MATDTVTFRPRCLFIQQWPKIGWVAGLNLSYYVSTYNRVETNQPPKDLFINSIWYLVYMLFISSYNIPVPNDSRYIISFPCQSGFGMPLLRKTKRSTRGTTVPDLPLHLLVWVFRVTQGHLQCDHLIDCIWLLFTFHSHYVPIL